MIRLQIKKNKMILAEKQQKIYVLSSGKIDKYGYLLGEEMLPSDQRRMKE